MTKATTSQKHAELKELGKKGRDYLFKRLQLTDEIVRDREYVDHHFGSEPRLIEVLEADEWSEFASRPGLTTLLRIYRAYPEKKIWEQYRYDWAAIEALMQTRGEGARPRTDWKAECQKRDLRIKELEAEVKSLKEELERVYGLLERLGTSRA